VDEKARKLWSSTGRRKWGEFQQRGCWAAPAAAAVVGQRGAHRGRLFRALPPRDWEEADDVVGWRDEASSRRSKPDAMASCSSPTIAASRVEICRNTIINNNKNYYYKTAAANFRRANFHPVVMDLWAGPLLKSVMTPPCQQKMKKVAAVQQQLLWKEPP
jgi:hypothetical protein